MRVTPKRIQRKRTRGWRMPEGAVYVGRPSKWGNPFHVGPAVFYRQQYGAGAGMNTSRRDSVSFYRRWLYGEIFDAEIREYDDRGFPAPRAVPTPPEEWQVRLALRGRDLACWCPLTDAAGNPVPCHADVLLELANGADQ